MSTINDPPIGPLNHVLTQNIQRLRDLERARQAGRTRTEKVLDGITAFAGSLAFVALHGAILIFWLLANTGKLGFRPWDPYPFVMLAMAASVEAIFISTFVLIGQNRQSKDADRRAELNLQIDLLAEHEVTRLIEMVEAIAKRLDVRLEVNDLHEISQDIDPTHVVEHISHSNEEEPKGEPPAR